LWELYHPNLKYLQELRELVGHNVRRDVVDIAKTAFSIAQGFTIHGGQQDSKLFPKTLQTLTALYPDLRVIYITRRDAFAQVMSRARAMRTNRWGLYHFRKDKVGKRDIKPMDFRSNINQLVQFAIREFKARQKARRLLANQPSRTVYYEDMCDNLVNTMWNTFRFLGVDWHPVKPETIKQAAKPLSKMVVAYEETRKRFERKLRNEIGRTTLDVI